MWQCPGLVRDPTFNWLNSIHTYFLCLLILAPSSSLGSPQTRGYTLYGESEARPLTTIGDVKTPLQPPQNQLAPTAGPSMPTTRVYHYQNPQTGHAITSLLPPNHPEMVCLQEGGHVQTSQFGLLGIVAAVLWFPLGIGLCLMDRRVTCKRCGATLSEGFCH